MASIHRGDWHPGDLFPTEQQLQDKYNLSRTTVRQAMRELEDEGLVTRSRGRGTFVSEPKVTHGPRFSLTDYLVEQGMQPGWEVLSDEMVPATPEVAERLAIDPEDEVFRLRRLRLADGERIGYHIAFVAPSYIQSIDHDSFTDGGSLRYLQAGGALDGSSADRMIEAVGANPQEARLLSVDPDAPLLLIRRLVVNANGQPIEDFRGVYRGDRFQYQISNLPSVHPLNA